MNSLQDLNYYSNVGIGFVDNITPGFVTFSNVTPVNQAVTVILDTPIIAPVGTDIIDSGNATISYSIDVSSLPGATVEWLVSMPPLANLSVSGNVYTVSNISGPLAWEQVKDPEVIMPIHNANSWTYTSTITYASTANTGTKSWTTGVTVTPINFIGNVTSITYTEDIPFFITGYPQLTDTVNGYTVTITPNAAAAIKTFQSISSVGNVVVNPTTKVMTINGTTSEINERLKYLKITPTVDYYLPFSLRYDFKFNPTGLVTTVNQAINSNGDQPEITQPQNLVYAINHPVSMSTYPQIVDMSGSSYTFTLAPNTVSAISNISTTYTGGTKSYNDSTKTLTLSGTKGQINNHLSTMTIWPGTGFANTFSLTYSMTNTTSNQVSTVTQTGILGLISPSMTSPHYAQYYEDQILFIDPLTKVNDVVGDLELEIKANNISSIYSIASNVADSGTYGTSSYNPITKTMTYSGTSSQINARLPNTYILPQVDGTDSWTLNYKLTSINTNEVATNYCDFVIGSSNSETNTFNLNQTYTENTIDFLIKSGANIAIDETATGISSSDPYVQYRVELTTSANVGYIIEKNTISSNNVWTGSGYGWDSTTNTYFIAGSKSDINSILPNLLFVPNINTSTAFNLTYKQYRAGQLQTNRTIAFTGTPNSTALSSLTGTFIFTSNSSISINSTQAQFLKCDLLIVGGTGSDAHRKGPVSGGWYFGGGGGGAGGVKLYENIQLNDLLTSKLIGSDSKTIPVTIGSAGETATSLSPEGKNGGNSEFLNLIAIGGGGGGSDGGGHSGGSGGGGAYGSVSGEGTTKTWQDPAGWAYSTSGGQGILGQGSNGGRGNYPADKLQEKGRWAGGGGGAGGTSLFVGGQFGSTNVDNYGYGGPGIVSDITGTAYEYGRGNNGYQYSAPSLSAYGLSYPGTKYPSSNGIIVIKLYI